MYYLNRTFLFLLSFFSFNLAAYEESLKATDINKIMHQILEHHVQTKEMTGQILMHSIKMYINQFDPYRIYLLEEEVSPFLTMSNEQLATVIEEYKKNDFSSFLKLNKIIQNSIERSRTLRKEVEVRAKQNFFQVNPPEKIIKQFDEITNEPFAENLDELKKRIYDNLEAFVFSQRKRYSDAIIAQRKNQTIQAYENQLRSIENQYLYVDVEGKPLSKNEQENLFTIHILKALASSLDAHTSFYENKEAYDMRVRLKKEFQGIGLILNDSIEGAKVSRMLEGGPADKSNLITKGDILLEVNGKNVKKLPFENIMDLLHDVTNPEITLKFVRPESTGKEEKLITVTLKRETIVLKSDRVDVSSQEFGNGIIGLIKLHSFYQGDGVSSEKDVKEAIATLKKKGNLKGLILDLRDNSGGFLSQAVKVAGLFITDGVIVISKYSDGDEKIYRDVDGKTAYDGPLVVLTSKMTASAAEIVAQSLQDYGVAIVVGDERTYGKGTIQTQTVTDNQSSSYFKVTVGKYYTVSGKTPQKEGVKSDVIVPGHYENEEIGEEYVEDSPGADKIAASYDDKLTDIAADIRPWYLKYYVPKLQHPLTLWKKMLPVLKSNSEHRIANNKNYQFYLKGQAAVAEEDSLEDEELGSLTTPKKNYGEDDLQLQEAINIVKDMVILHTVSATEDNQ